MQGIKSINNLPIRCIEISSSGPVFSSGHNLKDLVNSKGLKNFIAMIDYHLLPLLFIWFENSSFYLFVQTFSLKNHIFIVHKKKPVFLKFNV